MNGDRSPAVSPPHLQALIMISIRPSEALRRDAADHWKDFQ